jgi:hypothetical protein
VAKAHAAAIVSATAARLMPPMPVDDSGSCNRYSNARWLTDAEIATLGAWAAHGAPLGDSRKAPGPPAPPASLGAPDAVVDTGVTYVPAGAAGHEQDDYHCFVAPGPVSAAAFLVGFESCPVTPASCTTFIATSAPVANFNRCRGIACPPAR